MKLGNDFSGKLSLAGVSILLSWTVVACSPQVSGGEPLATAAVENTATRVAPTSTRLPATHTPEPEASQLAPAATDIWTAVVQRTPYPFTRPLPPASATVIDGTYTKVELKEATPFPCRRCADYRIEGGIWKLQLDRGVFRIYHEITGWRNVGSYSVEGDRVEFFNDPTCMDGLGLYTWELSEGRLILTAIEDACAIGVRADNFTSIPWNSCQPPNQEAAISGHWYMPEGCQ